MGTAAAVRAGTRALPETALSSIIGPIPAFLPIWPHPRFARYTSSAATSAVPDSKLG